MILDFTNLKKLSLDVTSTGKFHWNICLSSTSVENTVNIGDEISQSGYNAVFKDENKLLDYKNNQTTQTAALNIPSNISKTQYIYCWVGGYNETVEKFTFNKLILEYETSENSVHISQSRNNITAYYKVKDGKMYDAYLACYKEDGSLVEVKKSADVSDNALMKTTVNDTQKYTFKAFLWEDSTPMSDTYEYKYNGNENFADTSNVNLETGSLFSQSEKVGLNYIKSIDPDRLLAPSFEMHGLPAPNGKERYGGWERKKANNWSSDGGVDSFTLAGHSLGHWMSAAAAFYRDTGDDEILEKLSYAVDQLDKLQTETGSSYIGGCPEDTFTKCFAGNSKWANDYWVPWYGVHKIYQGLLDAYMYTDNDKAFKVLKKFSDWAVDGTANLSNSFMQSILNTEYGGMNEIFAYMYEFTGEEKYLNTARRFTHDNILNPLINGSDKLSGLHANTQIPKIIGAAKIYEENPEKYSDYRTASENFWNYVVNNRSYAIGGNSIAEHFEAEGMESLGVKTCESCNTYNMMRLTEHLFSWEHDSKYMDWYEDALYNHILGQQDPEKGEKMYFVSLLPGHHRVYEVKDEAWWCCTGTGMENPGRYTRCTYYEDGDDLYVNLYMSNDYKWKSKGLNFKTKTNYPYSETVKMTVENGNAQASLKFRVPSWCNNMKAVVGGEEYTSQDGYITINRLWSTNDEITISIPMELRTYYSRSDGQIAYKYGPITLAAPLGSVEGISGVNENITNETRIDSVTVAVPYIVTNNEQPDGFVEKVSGDKLEFKIPAEHTSTSQDITLIPFYRIHHQFYTVYFNINQEIDPFEKALNDVTIDKVEPDGQQDELGHGCQTNTNDSIHRGSFTGGGKNHMYRDAWGTTDDDKLPYFSYNMEVKDDQNYLCIALWGSDVLFNKGNTTYTREFDILVDGTIIGEASVNNDKPNEVIYNFYEIPTNLTAGKSYVNVKLQAKTKTSCACMLEMRTTSNKIE